MGEVVAFVSDKDVTRFEGNREVIGDGALGDGREVEEGQTEMPQNDSSADATSLRAFDSFIVNSDGLVQSLSNEKVFQLLANGSSEDAFLHHGVNHNHNNV